ncbi:hypothetical protein SAMN05446037_100320 [Anaerovirgula multivorans]|uniref:Uncharacterized protein n=1 Tax=Anaerovirgula multivorans TaxID=312168 RepID=A0A239B5T2_9FIRM|nr:hypothetical protein SAMN05446037_100320 [Anaerovirgula multivorans]
MGTNDFIHGIEHGFLIGFVLYFSALGLAIFLKILRNR